MVSSIVGLVIILLSMAYTTIDRELSGSISFFDPHAAAVVFGGCIGALMISLDSKSLVNMVTSFVEIIRFRNRRADFEVINAFHKELEDIWRSGNKSKILELSENAKHKELKIAANALIQKSSPAKIKSEFTNLRNHFLNKYEPVIDGWEIICRFGPSFGMVGTITGMVMLFRNMDEQGSQIGGAMALALLATLYGISIGAAVGGPMASRVNNFLNQRLSSIESLENTVLSLVADK